MKRIIGRTFLAAIVLVVLSIPTIPAPTETKKEESTKPAKNWSLAVKGGVTLNTGNTESQLITGGLDFNLKLKKIEYLTNVEIFYGTGQDVETVDKGKWYHKLAHKFKNRFNLYGTLSTEYDKFARIAFRGNAGLGLRYTIADTPKTASYFAASLNGEFTDALSNIANIGSFRLNLNYTLKKTFSSTSKYNLDFLYTANWGSFFNDYRFEVNASLSVAVKNPFSLKIEIYEKYTNHPLAQDLEKNDLILVTSLEISL